jgi:phenylacetate-CoA ligase
MHDHYDRLENRPPAARETALFRDLRHVLSMARSRAPALRAQLKGIDPATIMTRADLAHVPLRRVSDLLAQQDEAPPFGGLAATRLGALCHVFPMPGRPVALAGCAKDWWGMGRSLYAAGLRKGTTVLNCFAYDLSPFGHMIESGARAIGCPVIPAGCADLDRKLYAMRRLAPRFFCGPAKQLSDLLDHAESHGIGTTSLEAALVACCTSPGKRNEFRLRGIAVREALMTAELGPIAYESGTTPGLVVNEGLIVEIVDPMTRLPSAAGDEGEIVVTRLNPDYPLLRLATGLRSKILAKPSTCGRTNVRIACPREMNPASVEIDDTRVHIAQVREIAARHPEVTRIRGYTRRPRDRDEFILRVEHAGDAAMLDERLRETLRNVTHLSGTVELVKPGTLPDDDAMIVDERPLN